MPDFVSETRVRNEARATTTTHGLTLGLTSVGARLGLSPLRDPPLAGRREEPKPPWPTFQPVFTDGLQVIPKDPTQQASEIIPFKTGSGEPTSIPDLKAVVQPDNTVELEWDGDENPPPVNIAYSPE